MTGLGLCIYTYIKQKKNPFTTIMDNSTKQRQIDRQTNRQTESQTDCHTDRLSETKIQRDRQDMKQGKDLAQLTQPVL